MTVTKEERERKRAAKDFAAFLAEQDLSKAEAALVFGVHKRTVGHWAYGTAPIPRSVEICIEFFRKYKKDPMDYVKVNA